MKRLLWLLGVILIGGMAYLLFFFPVYQSKSIVVPYSMYKSGEQLNNAKNLVKWFSPFTINDTAAITKKAGVQTITKDDFQAEISNITMYSALIKAGSKEKGKAFLFTAMADSSEMFVSKITLKYATTLYRKWFSKSSAEKNAEQSLENLKDFMSDTRRFYGYEIKEVLVEDTSFLFTRRTVPVADRKITTKKMYEDLIAYAEKTKAGYNGIRIYYTLKSGSEITIFASIGVTNMVETPGDAAIQYKKMPYGKKLLMTTYQGPFSQSEKTFKVLEDFKTDHSLTSMAIPFQKILSDGYDFEDDQVVQLKIYYPVF